MPAVIIQIALREAGDTESGGGGGRSPDGVCNLGPGNIAVRAAEAIFVADVVRAIEVTDFAPLELVRSVRGQHSKVATYIAANN
jgi:hypothetical protein